MFGAPNRTAYDLNFSIMGIPVRVHPLFWLIAALLGFQPDNPPGIMIWIAVVFVSILVHEMGHAIAMRLFGHNPSIVLYAGGGLAMYQSMDSPWSSFGTNYGRRDSPWSKIIISAAGPAAGFLLAGIVIVYLIIASVSLTIWGVSLGSGKSLLEGGNHLLIEFVFDMLIVNIFWGMVNLLPIYPLDGGQIAREIAQMISPYDGLRGSLWLSLITAAAVAVLGFRFFGMFALFFAYFAFLNWQMLRGPGGFGGGGFGGGGFGGGGKFGGGRPW